jgi:hypothetical protein
MPRIITIEKKFRKDMNIDFEKVFAELETFLNYLKNSFPFKILKVNYPLLSN